MTKRGLTGNERRVLFGLVRYPTLNDRELSENLDVKVSTVTAIRRRLRRADFFVTRRIPMVHRLGWEILAAGYVRVDAGNGSRTPARMREILKDRLPNVFYLSASADHLTFLAAEPNYTALRRDLDEFRILLDKAGVLGDGDLGVMVFPMGTSILPAFFDYSHVLAVSFGLEFASNGKLNHTKRENVTLTRKELDVLRGLVRYPELSDKALAQRVKVSRQAVSKMRREFDAEDIVRTVRIPNIQLLGFDLFMVGFSRFRPLATLKVRMGAIEKALKVLPIFLLVSSESENVVFGAARNYEQFASLRSSMVSHAEEAGHLLGEPVVYLGLTSTTDLIRNCEYGPLVQNLTGPVPRSAR